MAVTAASLKTVVEVVISAEKLKDLTNQDDEGRTVINDALLLQVCKFAIAEYSTMTLQEHGQDAEREDIELNLMVTYVLYKLYEYAQNFDAMAEVEKRLDPRNQNLMRVGNTFTDTNAVHASESREQDYIGYRTSRSQYDKSEMDTNTSVYNDPNGPYQGS